MPTGTVIDAESQLRFLISCIRYSDGGKVDFEEVRKECDIVSKGAAAKRYVRLLKAHGLKKEAVKDTAEAKKTKAPAAKKRKLPEVEEDESDMDEPVKSESAVKNEVKGEVKLEDAFVKSEYPKIDGPSDTTPLHYPPPFHTQSDPTPAETQTEDDDEVLFVSATKRQSTTSAPSHISHHHPSPQKHPLMLNAPGTPSIDYAANTNLHQHLDLPNTMPMPRMTQTISPNSHPYSFAPATWASLHNSCGYL